MIELAGITRSFGRTRVLDGVSLTVPDRGRVVITGPSGSGKTTLLRIIAGLDAPDAGTVRINGKIASDPAIRIPPADRGIGFVFQNAALWPHLTVAGNIRFALHDHPAIDAAARIDELLDRMSIRHLKDRYPGGISGGEARRVALARALAPCPSWLLLDEPLTNIDDELKEDLLVLIDETARSAGSGIVYVTHNRHEAAAIAETSFVCRGGVILPP